MRSVTSAAPGGDHQALDTGRISSISRAHDPTQRHGNVRFPQLYLLGGRRPQAAPLGHPRGPESPRRTVERLAPLPSLRASRRFRGQARGGLSVTQGDCTRLRVRLTPLEVHLVQRLSRARRRTRVGAAGPVSAGSGSRHAGLSSTLLLGAHAPTRVRGHRRT